MVELESTPLTLLFIDELTLIVPQADVETLIPVADLKNRYTVNKSVAEVYYNRKDSAVFCFSENFNLLDSIPLTHKVCVLLTIGNKSFGLACNHIKNIAYQTIHPIKPCMQSKHSIISGFLLYENKLASMTSSHAIYQLIQQEIKG